VLDCLCNVLRWIRWLCDVTLSVYPHRAGLKNMPCHGGIWTYNLWNNSPMLCQGILAQCSPNAFAKGRRFESHRGQAYFSSLPSVDIHS
jgi:hypothetical protein